MGAACLRGELFEQAADPFARLALATDNGAQRIALPRLCARYIHRVGIPTNDMANALGCSDAEGDLCQSSHKTYVILLKRLHGANVFIRPKFSGAPDQSYRLPRKRCIGSSTGKWKGISVYSRKGRWQSLAIHNHPLR